MTDGPNTPPHGVPDWVRHLAREADCTRRHERSNAAANRAKEIAYASRERLIGIVGEDGRNGRLGDLRKDVDENTQTLKELVPKVTKNTWSGNLLTGVIAAALTTLAGLAINLLTK